MWSNHTSYIDIYLSPSIMRFPMWIHFLLVSWLPTLYFPYLFPRLKYLGWLFMHSSVSENVVTMEIFEHSHMYQLVSICVISYVIDKYNNQLRVVCVQVHVYMCRNTHRQETWLGKTSCLMKGTGKRNRIHDLYIIPKIKTLN